jgi:threonine dehydrogenase-like Zn-dependent dehydrogenase
MGADHVVDFTKTDPVAEIMRLTDGRGVDVAIEALGRQKTSEAALGADRGRGGAAGAAWADPGPAERRRAAGLRL